MRLWSLHPSYLDSKGLVALWREALLARKVLENKTKGYKFHPQLLRFKEMQNPILYINAYLMTIYEESLKRGYAFDSRKIKVIKVQVNKMSVTKGQLHFEFAHLLNKLKIRDVSCYERLANLRRVIPNPIFKVVQGDVAEWERNRAKK